MDKNRILNHSLTHPLFDPLGTEALALQNMICRSQFHKNTSSL